MKETWNLRDEVMDAVDKSFNTGDWRVALNISHDLCAEIEKNYRCDHIKSLGDEIVILRDELAKLKERLETAQTVVELSRRIVGWVNGNHHYPDYFKALGIYDDQMKDDSLGKKSEDTPQL